MDVQHLSSFWKARLWCPQSFWEHRHTPCPGTPREHGKETSPCTFILSLPRHGCWTLRASESSRWHLCFPVGRCSWSPAGEGETEARTTHTGVVTLEAVRVLVWCQLSPDLFHTGERRRTARSQLFLTQKIIKKRLCLGHQRVL